MISTVLLETLVSSDLEDALAGWRDELGWEVTERSALSEDLATFWDIDSARYPEFAVLTSPGSDRGFVRLVQGPEDDDEGSFHHPGLFNAELLCRDVDELHARLAGSSRFQLVCDPTTYDLGSTGGACSRSFATRGPGRTGVFFTTYLSVPPPRELPVCEHLVGPMFNSACAVEDAAMMESFYEGIVGMERRLEGRIASPGINRILELPSDWAFHMVVYKGEGDGLIEIDLHERELPVGFGSPGGRLKPGNSFLTLATSDLDGLAERARQARVMRSEPRPFQFAPYRGRRALILEGPAAERVEVMEAM